VTCRQLSRPLRVALALSVVAGACACTDRGPPPSARGPAPAPPSTASLAAGTPTADVPTSGTPTLARAPTNCPPPRPKLQRVSSRLAPLTGGRPVWAGFYARLDPRSGRLHLEEDAPHTPDGWRIKVLWAVAEDQLTPVTVHGRELRTGKALRIDVGDAPQSRVATLDPANPGTPAFQGEPREFPSYVYFPRAGCYAIEARWGAGHWRFVLAVGR
jgi:hypothetical protein